MGLPANWKIDPKDKAARKMGIVRAVFIDNCAADDVLVIEEPTAEDDGRRQSLVAPLEVVVEVLRAHGWKVEAPVGK